MVSQLDTHRVPVAVYWLQPDQYLHGQLGSCYRCLRHQFLAGTTDINSFYCSAAAQTFLGSSINTGSGNYRRHHTGENGVDQCCAWSAATFCTNTGKCSATNEMEARTKTGHTHTVSR